MTEPSVTARTTGATAHVPPVTARGGFFSLGSQRQSMSEFEGLDLQAVEDQMDTDEGGDGSDRIVLGVLDGSTGPDEWLETIHGGAVLVLNVDGDLNELAAGFARDVKETGGELVHFRGFLIVTPPGVTIDTDRLE
ncbi:Uncharacterized protein LC1Hm_1997 [Halomicrobium sp. LC1Hm]|nr:Uncharacterized protein LC1Hm_1997 [Halomicrobium sp. LC1Hm]